MTTEEKVVNFLMQKGKKIAFAESCTGGLCCARLVSVPNASGVLDVSFVTYANAAKVRFLGVHDSVIKQFGVVSEPVAGEMAGGVCRAADCSVGVGVSGIAGPTGGSPEKPVGTVCFGFCIDGRTSVYTKHFGSIGRNAVREKSADFVFETLLHLLEEA